MQKDIKILVVDDDETRRHELSVILEFLGEPAVITSQNSWKEQVESIQKEDVIAVFFGQSCQASSLSEIIEWSDTVALISMGVDIEESAEAKHRSASQKVFRTHNAHL